MEARADFGGARHAFAAMQLEKIRLHRRGDGCQFGVVRIHHQRRQLETSAHPRRQLGAGVDAEGAGTFGEEHQAAEIGAGAHRAIGGSGRIESTDFDGNGCIQSGHGMGLMSRG